jgi:hypothetical protein
MVLSHPDGCCSSGNLDLVAGPVLPHKRFRIELQHKRSVSFLSKQAGSVEAEDGAIVPKVVHHGGARIEKEARADREVRVSFEHDNAILPLSVIRQR